jgi:hypothetical protein
LDPLLTKRERKKIMTDRDDKPELEPDPRSSVSARLVNALHGDVFGQVLFLLVLFACPAFVAWLIGRACHYVLDGDAAALWESTLLARAQRGNASRTRRIIGLSAS